MAGNGSTSATTVGTDRPRDPGAVLELGVTEAPSPFVVMKKRALGHWGFLLGGGVVLFVVAVALFAPLLAPFDPYEQVLSRRLVDPVWAEHGSWTHVLGTDALGRDLLSRIIHGARISLMVGFFAAMLSGLVGCTLGIIGGYYGGRVDALVMYIVNVKLSLPPILVALSLVAVVGGSVPALILIIGFLFWDRYAVVTRSITQQLRVNDFVSAAEAVGASRIRIILTEILPNLANQIIVIASLEMALAILVEAVLSFLGLGVRPPTPAWGLMVAEGRSFMFIKPHLVMIPGMAIFLLVIAINMVGDGIRDISAPEGRN